MNLSSIKHRLVLGAVFCSLFPGFSAHAQEKEYMVKAAFIYNFVKFVEWPAPKNIASQSAIDICVLGGSPMNETSSIFKQASTEKLTLNLVNDDSARQAATHCHVVFVSSQAGPIAEALGPLKGQPVLTVSDMPGFVESGGMIGFVLSDNKIKFAINLKAIDSAGLHVNAQLLEIALKVIGR